MPRRSVAVVLWILDYTNTRSDTPVRAACVTWRTQAMPDA
jgi:hypothetical protein